MANRKEGIYLINVDNLFLDQLNPRLHGDSINESQEEIEERIYQREDIDELAFSLSVNGYFQEEPIIVVPQNVSDFNNIDSSNINSYKYTVIEGNRKTTSIKLLLDRNNKIVDSDFPKISNDRIEDNLKIIPAIIYANRDDVDIYLSIRHISGNRKWDAYAKAKYIYEKINRICKERKISRSNSIDILTTQIGDKKDIIKKNFIYFKIFEAIEKDIIDYSSKDIKTRFSLIEVAMAGGNTSIAKYIGIEPFRNIDLEQEPIKPEYIDNLRNITNWIFGKNENGEGSLISDSRNINSELKKILAKPEATAYLEKYQDIEGAMALTEGKDRLVIGNVRKAKVLLSKILDEIPNYSKNEEFKSAFQELKFTVKNIDTLFEI